jgi:hypothetical protein
MPKYELDDLIQQLVSQGQAKKWKVDRDRRMALEKERKKLAGEPAGDFRPAIEPMVIDRPVAARPDFELPPGFSAGPPYEAGPPEQVALKRSAEQQEALMRIADRMRVRRAARERFDPMVIEDGRDPYEPDPELPPILLQRNPSNDSARIRELVAELAALRARRGSAPLTAEERRARQQGGSPD